MHDIKYIKDNTKEFDNAISKRGGSPCGNKLLQKHEKYLSFLNKKHPQEIDFVPFIVGAGPAVPILKAIAIALASAVIQYALTDPGTIDGGETTIGSDSKSLLFSSSIINLTAQGSPLPIGYGRLKVGSSVIQSSMKSIPQTVKTSDAMQSNNYAPETEEGVFNQESNIEISNPSLY